jgi:hypothetical protein
LIAGAGGLIIVASGAQTAASSGPNREVRSALTAHVVARAEQTVSNSTSVAHVCGRV